MPVNFVRRWTSVTLSKLQKPLPSPQLILVLGSKRYIFTYEKELRLPCFGCSAEQACWSQHEGYSAGGRNISKQLTVVSSKYNPKPYNRVLPKFHPCFFGPPCGNKAGSSDGKKRKGTECGGVFGVFSMGFRGINKCLPHQNQSFCRSCG